uniref:Uncharacterized protein n=1 Tax=Rhizophora mucronata TaxID=61149 RepID=A0A2P2NPF3_RHIMU
MLRYYIKFSVFEKEKK